MPSPLKPNLSRIPCNEHRNKWIDQPEQPKTIENKISYYDPSFSIFRCLIFRCSCLRATIKLRVV